MFRELLLDGAKAMEKKAFLSHGGIAPHTPFLRELKKRAAKGKGGAALLRHYGSFSASFYSPCACSSSICCKISAALATISAQGRPA